MALFLTLLANGPDPRKELSLIIKKREKDFETIFHI